MDSLLAMLNSTFGRQIALETNELLGDSNAVLIFDESGFAKKGEASAGVARQWNGAAAMPAP